MVEEFLVGADGIAREQGLDAVRGEPLDVFDDLGLRLVEAQPVLPFVDQSGTGVHGAHEVVHMVDGLLAGLDHIVDAFVEHVQVEVGRHHGHFDELVATEDVQSGHLAIDPDQARACGRVCFAIVCIYHRCLVSVWVPRPTFFCAGRTYEDTAG